MSKFLRDLKFSESCVCMLLPTPNPTPWLLFGEVLLCWWISVYYCSWQSKLSLFPLSNQVSVTNRTSEKNLFERERPWVSLAHLMLRWIIKEFPEFIWSFSNKDRSSDGKYYCVSTAWILLRKFLSGSFESSNRTSFNSKYQISNFQNSQEISD